MKKILSGVGILLSCAILNVNAAAVDQKLCLRLTNVSNLGIHFVPPAGRDPGWSPIVEPNKSMVIGSDYTGCESNAQTCYVKIAVNAINEAHPIEIKVKPGAHITYAGPGHTNTVDNTAHVVC